MDQVKIGKFIASQRKINELTQKDLAQQLGISDRSVSKWENGICMPDISLFESLCKELNISYNELLSGEKIENINLVQENNLKNYVQYTNTNMKKFVVKILIIILLFMICLFMFSNLWITNTERYGGFLYLVIAIFTLFVPLLSLKYIEWNHIITIVSFIICCFFLLNEVHDFHYLFEKYELWGIGDELIIDFDIVRFILFSTILINCSVYLTTQLKKWNYK